MWSLILRRVALAVPTLFLVMVFVFVLQRMLRRGLAVASRTG